MTARRWRGAAAKGQGCSAQRPWRALTLFCAWLLVLGAAGCQGERPASAQRPAASSGDGLKAAGPTQRSAIRQVAGSAFVALDPPQVAVALGPTLPAYETSAERIELDKADVASDFRNGNRQFFAQTAPPPVDEYRPFGEWEEMTEVWTTYSATIPGNKSVRRMFAEQTLGFVRHSKPQVEAFVIVPAEKTALDFGAALDQYGATAEDKAHVHYVQLQNQSIWLIDYGPFPLLRKADGRLALTDYVYYKQRQLDDAIPSRLAFDHWQDVTVFRMPFPFEGGNIQSDGIDRCVTSNRALSNTGFSAAKVRNLLHRYNACKETFIVKDISDDGTGHIDMFLKWSASDELIISRYDNEITLDYNGDGKTETLPLPCAVASDYQKVFSLNQQRMDANVGLFTAATAHGGKPYKVHRLSMMTRYKDSLGDVPRTFINSTFTNGVNVFPSYTAKSCRATTGDACMVDADCKESGQHCAAGICTTGATTRGCDEILGCGAGLECVDDPLKVKLIANVQQQWEEAMPTWKHVGVRADTIANWSGAIHCITRTIPKAPRGKVIDDALCLGGSCACVEGGADSECTADSDCQGPEWVCNCQICKGKCKGSGLACTDDADCGALKTSSKCDKGVCSGELTACSKDAHCGVAIEPGACVINRDQLCDKELAPGGGCPTVPWEGVCTGQSLQMCDKGTVKKVSCGGCCGWLAASGANECLEASACSAGCVPECEVAGATGCSVEGSHPWTCVDVGGCLKRTYGEACAFGCSGGACNDKTRPHQCPIAPGPDAGVGEDAGTADDGGAAPGTDASAGTDAGPATDAEGGKDAGGGGGKADGGCQAAGRGPGSGAGGLLMLVVALSALAWRRRGQVQLARLAACSALLSVGLGCEPGGVEVSRRQGVEPTTAAATSSGVRSSGNASAGANAAGEASIAGLGLRHATLETPSAAALGPYAQQILPAYRTAAEAASAALRDEAGDYRNANPQFFAATVPPPQGKYRPFGEWETMQEVWTTYSSGMPGEAAVRRMFAEQTIAFLRHSSPPIDAYVIVNSGALAADFDKAVQSYGITPAEKARITSITLPNQTIWHIDYGAFPLLHKDTGALAFVDWNYYANRHLDDALGVRVPREVYGATVWRVAFPFEGGNIQADGVQQCATTTRALSNTGFSQLKVRNLLQRYAGCNTTYIVKDITDDGTGHLDMFFKWTTPGTVLMSEYTGSITADVDGDGAQETVAIPGKVSPSYGGVFATNAKRMDDNAALFASAKASDGKPFTVHRLPMMTHFVDKFGNVPRTFINSTLTNGVNVYPSYATASCHNPGGAKCIADAGCASGQHCAAGRCTTGAAAQGCDEIVGCPSGQTCKTDGLKVALVAEAQQKWQAAMPGWKHVGLRADTIALWSGAIHCITRTVPKAPAMDKSIADGACVLGKCGCAAGGSQGVCDASSDCFGPEWLCNCTICTGVCASGKACTDDADCSSNGVTVVAGACDFNEKQGCYGLPPLQSGGGGGTTSPCGALSYEGKCDGNSLSYCDGTPKGQTCSGCC